MNKKMSMKKTVKRVTRSLALVAVAALLLVCGLGCAQLQAVGKLLSASTPTPLPTPEPTPTPVPTPTPEPTPTPTPRLTPPPTLVPLVALTPEEEAKAIAELGIVDPDTEDIGGAYFVIGFITASGEQKVMMVEWMSGGFGENRDSIWDVFTKELLFTTSSISLDEMEPSVNHFSPEYSPIREMEAVNPYFKGAAVNAMDVLFYLVDAFPKHFGYAGNDDLFFTLVPNPCDLVKWIITDSTAAKIYVTVVPEQFRVKASDLIPGYGSTSEPEA